MKFETYKLTSPDGSMETLWETERKTIYLKLSDHCHLGIALEPDGAVRINTTSGKPLVVFPHASNTIVIREGTHQ